MNRTSTLAIIATVLAIGFPVVGAYAQAPPGMQQISGKYQDVSNGLEITLPDGWTGFAIPSPSRVSTAVAGPNGPSMNGDLSNPMMIISVSDKQPINATRFQPPSTGSNNQQSECSVASSQKTTVNGMSAFTVSGECTKPTPIKAKGYTFQTDTKNISILYASSSSANFDKYVSQFDGAVGTLKISNAVDVNVVPEFPVAAIAGIASVIGVIAVLGRTKFIRSP